MQITPISPTDKPRWILAKPHYKVDTQKMELTPIDVEFVYNPPAIVEAKIMNWGDAILLSVLGAVIVYIFPKIITGFL